MRLAVLLCSLVACSPIPTGDGGDPMVGEWRGTSFTNDDGDTLVFPLDEDGWTTTLDVTFTAEPRGLLTWHYIDPDDVESAATYEFVIDVFDTGRWLVEIEDGGSDMILDCSAESDAMQCTGTCDGLSCTLAFTRADG